MKTQPGTIEHFLTEMASTNEKVCSKHFPDKELVKLWTYKHWGNRYGKGYRFSYTVTHKEATMKLWQDFTLQKPEDFAMAKQTIEKLGYEFTK